MTAGNERGRAAANGPAPELTTAPESIVDHPAIFPRRRAAPTAFQLRHQRRRNARACQAACMLADDDGASGPVGPEAERRRLDPDQRLAQIDHARRHGFQSWEIAALVSAPVTADERARAAG